MSGATQARDPRGAALTTTRLSRSPAPLSSRLRLAPRLTRGGRAAPPGLSLQPHDRNGCLLATVVVWAHPGSLATTTGLLSLPRGTEMFQFPRCPPPSGGVRRNGRVAPFGDRGLTACTRLPHAFRSVATSFIGAQRRGILRVLLLSSLLERSAHPAASAARVSRRAATPCVPVVCCIWRCSALGKVRCPSTRDGRGTFTPES